MYCERADLTAYVLDAYLTAAEEQTSGIVNETMNNVAGEIDDALRARFVLPLATVPETLKRIAAIITAYRIVGAITSLMASESGSNNEWIPLQTQYKQAVKDLEAVRTGNLSLGLQELGEETIDTEDTIVITPKRKFDMRGW